MIVPAGVATPVTLVNRDASAGTLDLFIRWVGKKFEIEAEGIGIYGSIGNVGWDPTAAAIPATIRQGAGVLRGKYKLGDGGRFHVGGEMGIASGDNAPGFGNFPGRCNLTLPSTDPNRCGQVALDGAIDGNQVGAAYPSLNNYRFNPAYQVDLILWRRILGTVTDAWYLKPTFKWDVLDGLTVGAQVIYSQALFASSTPSQVNKPLGIELDLGVKYQSDDGFVFFLDYGLLKMLSGFDITTEREQRGDRQPGRRGPEHPRRPRHRLLALGRHDRPDLEGGLGLDGPLHRALVGDPHQRVPVLLREVGRDLDVEVHAGERAVLAVVEPLDDADPLGGEAALLAEPHHEDPRAGPHRRREERERASGRSSRLPPGRAGRSGRCARRPARPPACRPGT